MVTIAQQETTLVAAAQQQKGMKKTPPTLSPMFSPSFQMKGSRSSSNGMVRSTVRSNDFALMMLTPLQDGAH